MLQQASPSTCRPSLTVARHDSLRNVQAGTERFARPNQKIAQKRRTECHQIRYRDPKTSSVHETGASPNTRLPTAFAELDRGILGAMIRMVDHAARLPLPERHVEGVEHDLLVQAGRHRP